MESMLKALAVFGPLGFVFCFLLTSCDKFERGPLTPREPHKAESAPESKKEKPQALSVKPVQVTGVNPKTLGKGPYALVAGSGHTCVGDSSGSVLCWGQNSSGELGIGKSGASVYSAQSVGFLKGASLHFLAAGDNHTCAIVGQKRQVYCWGSDERLQLGRFPYFVDLIPAMMLMETNSDRSSPSPQPTITPLAKVSHLSAKGDHTCAIANKTTSASQVSCWGGEPGEPAQLVTPLRNPQKHFISEFAALGMGQCTIEEEKLLCSAPDLERAGDGLEGRVHKISGGWQHVCALWASTRSSHKYGVRCFGRLPISDKGEENELPSEGLDFLVPDPKEVASGHNHACALTQSGKVFCWGENESGKAGGGADQAAVKDPIAIDLPHPALAIAPGERHSCALLNDRTVWCWGDNSHGQLGVRPQSNGTQQVRNE